MPEPTYYFLASLPPPDPPGGAPPLSLAELPSRVPSGSIRLLVRTVLLGDDLSQRDTILAGAEGAAEPAVLTEAQLRGGSPLPSELGPAGLEDRFGHGPPVSTLPQDSVWRRYFRHAAEIAQRHGSDFLARWVRYEVTARNALTVQRARALGIEPRSFRVARELVDENGEVDRALEHWAAAPDPLAATRALIGAQWRWVDRCAPTYSFHADEFVAYAAKLVLQHRWYRTETGPVEGRSPALEGVA